VIPDANASTHPNGEAGRGINLSRPRLLAQHPGHQILAVYHTADQVYCKTGRHGR